jgi:outer membrane protein assembly factor BamD
MKKRIFIIFTIFLVLSFTITSCKSKKKVEINPNDMGTGEIMYNKANSFIKKNPEKARLLFKEIIQLYPESIYAKKAKIGIADSYFKQKDSASLLIANAEYQEYVNYYPDSPDAIYAKYQAAMCYYKMKYKPGRDQTYTFKAVEAFDSLIKSYPDTEEAKKAKELANECRKNLGIHYYKIGRSNYILKSYRGAISRFKQVTDNYPEFDEFDKLYYYTGMSYTKLRDYDSAMSFFQKVLTAYPKSKYANKSKKMLKKIVKLKKTAPPFREVKRKKKSDK